MSPRPWMPLYVADYRADTAHLNASEHGAYLLLIMHYWQTGGLPVEDMQLARIACMTNAQWRRARPVIATFFSAEWKHKRIDEELARATEISNKRRASVNQRYNKRSTKVHTIVDQKNTHARASSPSQSHSEVSNDTSADVVGEDPKARLFRIGKTILVSFGVAEKRTGALIGQWLKAKNDPRGLLAAIQYARDQNVAEPVAYISAVVREAKPNGTAKTDLCALAAELADEARQREAAAGIFRPPDAVGSH